MALSLKHRAVGGAALVLSGALAAVALMRDGTSSAVATVAPTPVAVDAAPAKTDLGEARPLVIRPLTPPPPRVPVSDARAPGLAAHPPGF